MRKRERTVLVGLVVIAFLWPGLLSAQQQTVTPPPTPTLASAQATAIPTASPTSTHTPAPTATPNPASSGERKAGPAFTGGAVWLAALLIGLLGLVFYWQLQYAHTLEQTSYLGRVYRESIVEFEFKKLSAQHREDWTNGEYHQEILKAQPPPALEERLRVLDDRWGEGELARQRQRDMVAAEDPWVASENRRPGLSGSGLGFRQETTNDAERAEQEEYRRLRRAYLEVRESWRRHVAEAANQLYQADLAQDKTEAEKRADSAVGETDIALLRGRGPQFVLEFTALIVIIFSAVVLGVLDRLDNQQIGTLLAAIAGYVLGRAAAGAGQGAPPPPPPAPPAARAAQGTPAPATPPALANGPQPKG